MQWREICGSFLVFAACGDDPASGRSASLQNTDGSVMEPVEGGAIVDAGIEACVPMIDPDASASLLSFDLPANNPPLDPYQHVVFGPKLCTPSLDGAQLTFVCEGGDPLEVTVDPSVTLDQTVLSSMGSNVLVEAHEVVLFEAIEGTGFSLSVRSEDNSKQILWYVDGSLATPAEGLDPLTFEIDRIDCEAARNICNQFRGAALTVSDGSTSTTVNVQGTAMVGDFSVVLKRALRLEPLGSVPTCPSSSTTLATYLIARVRQ